MQTTISYCKCRRQFPGAKKDHRREEDDIERLDDWPGNMPGADVSNYIYIFRRKTMAELTTMRAAVRNKVECDWERKSDSRKSAAMARAVICL